MREKVRCIEDFDVVQGALDYNAYLIKNVVKNKRENKQLSKQEFHYTMSQLELNIKKLAKLADGSIALREYTFDPEETVFPTSAVVKGIMNEKRANKLSYSDLIRNDHFTTDYKKISRAIDHHEMKVPYVKRRKNFHYD